MLDTDWLIVAFLLIAWVALFLMGGAIDSYYAIASGLAAILLALELWALTANVELTAIWFIIAAFTLTLGVRGIIKDVETS